MVSLEEAEERLFRRYGLDPVTRELDLPEPPVRTRLLEAGEGPPVLFVHGGGASASVWVPLLAELQGARALAVDRPGCGHADPFDYEDVDLRRHGVAFLESTLDALGLDRAVVAGNSMGGLWGTWLAIDRPERVAALVQLGCPALLLDTSAPLPMRLLAARRPAPVPQLSPGEARRIVNKLAGGGTANGVAPELLEAMVAAEQHWARGPTRLSLIARSLNAAGARDDVRLDEEDLARVGAPVLFLWGERDEYGPPAAGLRACEMLPDGRMHVLPAGHLPWLDQPRTCARLMEAFLAEQVRG